MNDQNITSTTETTASVAATPLRCLIGAIISGGMGYAVYSLMIAIATTFAKKPIHSHNELVIKLTSAVRTLVVGIVALGSGIFAIVAIGLFALGIQLLLQNFTKAKNS
ncbi:DUF3082 domain-containing protein [Anabaena sp. UHCC 0399]|uniref:DUF3082 domain-containing protein n=1 Tax=Anabaena sp. UHCC 0399 TaxID=3110238 RepID=UPI002B218B9D|nr:DUF3082 domain-containing protein [Anabaena sp. UHCC 0399]MEA5569077.1 DUF3082 domain-containing protein [Anabaena sp. UHCC 0399]